MNMVLYALLSVTSVRYHVDFVGSAEEDSPSIIKEAWTHALHDASANTSNTLKMSSLFEFVANAHSAFIKRAPQFNVFYDEKEKIFHESSFVNECDITNWTEKELSSKKLTHACFALLGINMSQKQNGVRHFQLRFHPDKHKQENKIYNRIMTVFNALVQHWKQTSNQNVATDDNSETPKNEIHKKDMRTKQLQFCFLLKQLIEFSNANSELFIPRALFKTMVTVCEIIC